MRRKLIIAGIFLGFVLAAVLVVLATRQDVQPTAQTSIDITPGRQIVLQPQGGYARMSVVSELPKSNAVPAAAKN
jgi:hypothetical protein